MDKEKATMINFLIDIKRNLDEIETEGEKLSKNMSQYSNRLTKLKELVSGKEKRISNKMEIKGNL